MLETLVTIAILGYSTWRCYKNPFSPWITLIYVHSLAYWLRLRVPFFYTNRNILNYLVLFLTLATFIYHAYKSYDRQAGGIGYKPTATHQILLVIIAYSWLSLMWSPGYDNFLAYQGSTFRNVLASQVIYLLILPVLFMMSVDKTDFRIDLRLIGLIVLPLITLTTDFEGRSAQYLFLAIDPDTGDFAAPSANPLQLAYFGLVLLFFALIFMERRAPVLIAHGAIAAIAAYLMILSQSRGQLISAIAILALLLPFRWPRFRSRHMLVFGPLSLFLLGLFALNISTIFAFIFRVLDFDISYIERFSGDDLSGSWAARVHFIETEFEHWISSAWALVFGLGTAASFGYVGVYIHNIPLETFFEQGIFMGLLFLLAMGLALRDIALALDLRNVSNYERRLMMFFAAQFLAQILISIKQGMLVKSMDLLSHAIFSSIYARHLIMRYAAQPAKPRVAGPVPALYQAARST